MSGGGKKGGQEVTIGHRYFLGMHMSCSHGPIDMLHEIAVGEKLVWPLGDDQPPVMFSDDQSMIRAVVTAVLAAARPKAGTLIPPPPGAPSTPPSITAPSVLQSGQVSASGTIYVNAPEVFGGEAKEGGIQGFVDVLFGEPTLGQNPYLTGVLGSLVPAFRGIFSLVIRQCYVAAMNPYIKPWSVFATRIFRGHDGQAQWYFEKAAIPAQTLETITAVGLVEWESIGWKYKESGLLNNDAWGAKDFDDSDWDVGQGAFGSEFVGSPLGLDAYTAIAPAGNKRFWIRRQIEMASTFGRAKLHVRADDECAVFWNGVRLPGGTYGSETMVSPFVHEFDVPPVLLRSTNTLAIRCRDAIDDSEIFLDASVEYIGYTINANQPDMNPAHIIRECLVASEWGKGYDPDTINDDAFIAAADTLSDEGLGISIPWSDSGNIDDFISFILEHIDGELYSDITTGLWTLVLVRDDYVADDLPLFDPSNVRDVDDFARPSASELTNRIVVTYWDRTTRKQTPIQLDNQPLQESNDGVINLRTLDRSGFTDPNVAARVAQRELKTLSTPLASGTLTVNRDGLQLNKGSAFKLSWPELGIVEMIVRVAAIDYGSLADGGIRVSFIEDVFSTPITQLIASPISQWEDTRSAPVAMTVRYVGEMPYWTIIKELIGEDASAYADIDPTSNALVATGVRMSPDTLSAGAWLSQGSSPYAKAGNLQTCAAMTISDDCDEMLTILPYSAVSDPDRIVFSKYALWDDELVMVYDLNPEDETLTVARAVLDTVPTLHEAGSTILFLEGYQFLGHTEYEDTESVNVKLVPKTSLGELDLADAPVDTYVFAHRHIRPYPPGNVKVNTEYFPVVIGGTEGVDSLTWVHRNRLTQTVYLVGFTEASITPEVGTTYNVNIYGEAGLLLHTQTGITGTSATAYSNASELTDSGVTYRDLTPRPNCRMTVVLASERDGYASWQSHSITLDRADYGFSYGRYYGGYL